MKTPYCAFNVTKQSFISLGVSVADTPFARLRGLLGKMRMRSDEALWVVPSHGVHTIGVRFPIDVIYLDAKMKVVHAVENLGPLRLPLVRRNCASVLALPVRSIFDSGTQVDDQLLIGLPEDFNRYWESQGAETPNRDDGRQIQPETVARRRLAKWVPQWLFGNDPEKG